MDILYGVIIGFAVVTAWKLIDRYVWEPERQRRTPWLDRIAEEAYKLWARTDFDAGHEAYSASAAFSDALGWVVGDDETTALKVLGELQRRGYTHGAIFEADGKGLASLTQSAIYFALGDELGLTYIQRYVSEDTYKTEMARRRAAADQYQAQQRVGSDAQTA